MNQHEHRTAMFAAIESSAIVAEAEKNFRYAEHLRLYRRLLEVELAYGDDLIARSGGQIQADFYLPVLIEALASLTSSSLLNCTSQDREAAIVHIPQLVQHFAEALIAQVQGSLTLEELRKSMS